jgi:hypothetical protein
MWSARLALDLGCKFVICHISAMWIWSVPEAIIVEAECEVSGLGIGTPLAGDKIVVVMAGCPFRHWHVQRLVLVRISKR